MPEDPIENPYECDTDPGYGYGMQGTGIPEEKPMGEYSYDR